MDVILVDENDVPVGHMEKLEVHQKALLHRAFSIFIFNSNAEMLLHKRADKKYHSAGLWFNTCCSHPRDQEPVLDAAKRRLQEEMGCEMKGPADFSTGRGVPTTGLCLGSEHKNIYSMDMFLLKVVFEVALPHGFEP